MDKNKLHIKEPGFTTPKNYFDALESHLLDRITLDATVSNKSPFKTPENYFEELQSRLLKIALEKSKPRTISIFRNKSLQYAAAIAAILLVFVSIYKFQSSSNTDAITSTQIENYIDNGFLEVSPLDLEVLFTDEMLEDSSFISTIDQEELFDYLSYEIDEIYLTND